MATARHDPAPHGFEEDGVTPKAPYGLNVDGTPRKSNRGARPGQRGNSGPRMKTTTGARATKSNAERKQMLLGLADMCLVMPLAAASMAPPVVARVGQKQADALAADAFIVNQHMNAVADGLIVLSASKPGLLAWMDKAEEKAPWMMLGLAVIQLSQALAQNHASPNLEMAAAARNAVIGRAQNQHADQNGENVNHDERIHDPESEFANA